MKVEAGWKRSKRLDEKPSEGADGKFDFEIDCPVCFESASTLIASAIAAIAVLAY